MASKSNLVSLFLLFVLCIFTAIYPEQFNTGLSYLHNLLLNNFGYLYQWLSGAILIIAIIIVLTPKGGIILGDKKKYIKNIPYYSLIFSTGMGVSMIYWGVLEPLAHLEYGMDKKEAMVNTYFNWGVNAWSYYFIVAIFILIYKKGKQEIFKNKFISIVVIFTTVAGLALSIIYSIDAIRMAPEIIFSKHASFPYLIIIILSCVSYISVKSGITRWMSRFSMINVFIAIILMGWIFFNMPEKLVVGQNMLNYGTTYIAELVPLTFTETQEKSWMVNWPYTYYAAWIGWSLFVGGFIAIISQGRSLRNIAFSILIVPTVFSIIWFTIFGSAAIQTESKNLFELLASFPLNTFFKYLSLGSLMLFFVTSEDSGSHVLHMLDPKISRGVWITIMAALATVILNLGGNSVAITRTLVALLSFPLLIIVGYMSLAVIIHFFTPGKIEAHPEFKAEIKE